MFKNAAIYLFSILSLVLVLTACNEEGVVDEKGKGTGTLNLNITDAPIDSAAKVVVSFSGVSIKPSNGPAFDINFVDDDGLPVIKTIDLLHLQWPISEPMLVNHVLDVGHYEWIRLKVITSETTTDSYIELDDGSQHPLYVPSGDQTGLKLIRGFDISEDGTLNFTIDFDLRKSVVAPSKPLMAYKLKPTLRIVENSNVGHIKGAVSAATINHVDCIGDNYAVYVFVGNNITPDDVDGIDPDPIKTVFLSNTFEYSVGYLAAGTYTLSFTCQANDDHIDSNDIINFIGTRSETINAGETTISNFD